MTATTGRDSFRMNPVSLGALIGGVIAFIVVGAIVDVLWVALGAVTSRILPSPGVKPMSLPLIGMVFLIWPDFWSMHLTLWLEQTQTFSLSR